MPSAGWQQTPGQIKRLATTAIGAIVANARVKARSGSQGEDMVFIAADSDAILAAVKRFFSTTWVIPRMIRFTVIIPALRNGSIASHMARGS